jgi:hypothetical protein
MSERDKPHTLPRKIAALSNRKRTLTTSFLKHYVAIIKEDRVLYSLLEPMSIDEQAEGQDWKQLVGFYLTAE